MVQEGALELVELTRRREPLHGGDLPPLSLQGEIGARVHGLAVEQHHAGAALGVVAPLLGAGEAEGVADRPQQARMRLDLHRIGDAVHVERCGDLHVIPPWSAGLAGTGMCSPLARARAPSMARRPMTAALALR